MDRFTRGAVFAAVLLSLGLSACGGGGGSADAPAGGSGPTATVQGVSTPSSVSVVTAKNAQ
jgi:hypothetical protein